MKKIKTLLFAICISSFAFGQNWNTQSPNILYPTDSSGDTANVKVGIGTNNPQTTLDVDGETTFRGYVSFNDSIRIKGDLHIGESSLILKSHPCSGNEQTGEELQDIGLNDGVNIGGYSDEILSSCGVIKVGGEPILEGIKFGIGKAPKCELDVLGDIRAASNNSDYVRLRHDGNNGYINTSAGDLILNNGGSSVHIGTSNSPTDLTVHGQAHTSDLVVNNNATIAGNLNVLGLMSYLNLNIANNATIGANLNANIANINTANLNLANINTNLTVDGKVAIGSINTSDLGTFNLGVEGGIISDEVKVASVVDWPDYVFDSEYNLATLQEVEEYIAEHNHLPDVPSERAVYENGIDVADMFKLMMRKIEELTLYTIEQEKHIIELQNQISK